VQVTEGVERVAMVLTIFEELLRVFEGRVCDKSCLQVSCLGASK